MQSDPLVCAIMLVNGRAAMVRRAVASFRAQTYTPRLLFIYDTGPRPIFADICVELGGGNGAYEYCAQMVHANPSIGTLRNDAISRASAEADIICHFDSDDVSHPQRIAEQVALLQASGADCVGYREALFWDTRGCNAHGLQVKGGRVVEGAAWLYRDPLPMHCLGASMCYWRKTWERRPFDHISHGEDYRFCSRVKTVGFSSLHAIERADVSLEPPLGKRERFEFHGPINNLAAPVEPRIICGIHGDRQSGGYDLKGSVWKRSPQWDAHCATVMAL